MGDGEAAARRRRRRAAGGRRRRGRGACRPGLRHRHRRRAPDAAELAHAEAEAAAVTSLTLELLGRLERALLSYRRFELAERVGLRAVADAIEDDVVPVLPAEAVAEAVARASGGSAGQPGAEGIPEIPAHAEVVRLAAAEIGKLGTALLHAERRLATLQLSARHALKRQKDLQDAAAAARAAHADEVRRVLRQIRRQGEPSAAAAAGGADAAAEPFLERQGQQLALALARWEARQAELLSSGQAVWDAQLHALSAVRAAREARAERQQAKHAGGARREDGAAAGRAKFAFQQQLYPVRRALPSEVELPPAVVLGQRSALATHPPPPPPHARTGLPPDSLPLMASLRPPSADAPEPTPTPPLHGAVATELGADGTPAAALGPVHARPSLPPPQPRQGALASGAGVGAALDRLESTRRVRVTGAMSSDPSAVISAGAGRGGGSQQLLEQHLEALSVGRGGPGIKRR